MEIMWVVIITLVVITIIINNLLVFSFSSQIFIEPNLYQTLLGTKKVPALKESVKSCRDFPPHFSRDLEKRKQSFGG